MANAAPQVVCRQLRALPPILRELPHSSLPGAPTRMETRSPSHARLAQRAPTKRTTSPPRALHLIPKCKVD